MILRYDKIHRLKVRAVKAHSAQPGAGLRRRFLVMLVLMLPLLLFAAYDYHSVRKGDTLYGLSKRYGVSVEQIRKLNDLQSDNLSIGQKLKIKEQAKPKPAASQPNPSEPKPAVPAPVTITAPPPPAVAAVTPQPESTSPAPVTQNDPPSLTELPN